MSVIEIIGLMDKTQINKQTELLHKDIKNLFCKINKKYVYIEQLQERLKDFSMRENIKKHFDK